MENTTISQSLDKQKTIEKLLLVKNAIGWGFVGQIKETHISLYNIKENGIECWSHPKGYQTILWQNLEPKDWFVLESFLAKVLPVEFEVYREKYLISFKNPKTKEVLSVDLKNKQFLKTNAKGSVRSIKNPNTFFAKMNGKVIAKLIPTDDHFAKFMDIIIKRESNCKNMGTLLIRLLDNIHLETYITANVPFSSYITVPYNFFDKDVRELLNSKNFTYNERVERFFGNNHDIGKSVLYFIKDKKNFADLFDYFAFNMRDLLVLVQDYNYDIKTLIQYCSDRNFSSGRYNYGYHDILTFLADYARMADRVYPNGFIKYPQNLVEYHDGVSKLYEKEKIKYNDASYIGTIDKAFEFKGKDYSVIYPKSTGDIQSEGRLLCHCVGSYIDRVLKKHTRILFMRKNDDLQTPLVTLEVYEGRISQARGKYNRNLSYEEKTFLEEYAKKQKLRF